MKIKLKNKFNVGDFMLSAKAEFVFSKKGENYLLLNKEDLATNESFVNSLIDDNKKVVVIDDIGMTMQSYNIPSADIFKALSK